jgi:hypothetical protein
VPATYSAGFTSEHPDIQVTCGKLVTPPRFCTLAVSNASDGASCGGNCCYLYCTQQSSNIWSLFLVGVVTGTTPWTLIGIITGPAGPERAGTIAAPVEVLELFLVSAQTVDPNVPLLVPPMS